jgi:hypothetical protein
MAHTTTITISHHHKQSSKKQRVQGPPQESPPAAIPKRRFASSKSSTPPPRRVCRPPVQQGTVLRQSPRFEMTNQAITTHEENQQQPQLLQSQRPPPPLPLKPAAKLGGVLSSLTWGGLWGSIKGLLMAGSPLKKGEYMCQVFLVLLCFWVWLNKKKFLFGSLLTTTEQIG